MTPERWEKISDIFDQALELDGSRRAEYLDRVCANDPELRHEIDSLVASHQQAGSKFLDVPALAAASAAPARGWRVGQRIGPYLVTGLLGHGGMGEVFSATRADGQFEKHVAVKLVRGGYDNQYILDRFRNERQILASLVHPNIAQLLDGGTTGDGIPYLVMELVEGVPIDEFCADHRLSVTERLRIFSSVCSAVQYAHQHLVIHRDIKPGNIFVTHDATPKLLDFGIAKIIGDSGEAEATSFRPMTPEFASPEQVRGDTITTASDVYSLGVVLYRLLTGQSPYPVNAESAHALSRAITDTEPERPSTVVRKIADASASLPKESGTKLQKRLQGDLDAILLKALRKEPQQRYGSVEQLAEDIRRHMKGLPVYARKGTWSYHAGKFIQRHRAGVVAAGLVIASLVGGIVATVHEARIAEANRQRAEKRFNDVRQLANSLMFEVHDSIRQLPGAVAARKLIVERAQQYLDSLAQESRSDPILLRDLATAYGRLAKVQGDGLDANLGNSAQSLNSYRKAVELLTVSDSLKPGDIETQTDLATAYMNLSMILDRTGDRKKSKELVLKAQQLLESLAQKHPDSPLIQSDLGNSFERLGMAYASENDLQRAKEYYEQSLRIFERLGASNPNDTRTQSLIAFAHKHIGSVLMVQMQLDPALEHYRAAMAIDEANLKRDPQNLQFRYNITYTYSDTGWILDKKGDTDGALRSYETAARIREELAAADPNDVRSRSGLGYTYGFIAHTYQDKADYPKAITYLKKSLAIRQSLVQKDPSNDNYPFLLADTQARIGVVYSIMAFLPNQVKSRQRTYCASAESWMQKSLPAYLAREANHKLMGTEVYMPKTIREEMQKCERILTSLR